MKGLKKSYRGVAQRLPGHVVVRVADMYSTPVSGWSGAIRLASSGPPAITTSLTIRSIRAA